MSDWSRVLFNGWPGAEWAPHDVNDLNTLEWFTDSPPAPTQQEIIDKAVELQAAFDAKDAVQVALQNFQDQYSYGVILLAIKRDAAGLQAIKNALQNVSEADLIKFAAVD